MFTILPMFFEHVLNFCQLHEQEKVNIVSMFHFLETDIREQIKYEMRTETSVDNNDLRYEIKFSQSTHLLMFLSLEALCSS